MKKKLIAVFAVLCLSLSLAACGESSAASITLDDVTAAIQTVDSSFSWNEEKPYYDMIGAEDGWIGYLNGTTPVKVYQYADQQAYDDAVETFGELIGDFPKNGNFVLECNDPAVTEAFENIGK